MRKGTWKLLTVFTLIAVVGLMWFPNNALSLRISSFLYVQEVTSQPPPLSGFGAFYPKTDGKPYFQNDEGEESNLLLGGGAGAAELNDLSDVGDTTATDGNVLRADGNSWESAQLDLDDIADGSSYERVDAGELAAGVYKDATTGVKGIASFVSDFFSVASGAVSIVNNAITEALLKCVNSAVDEYALTYEATTGDFEWHAKFTTVQDIDGTPTINHFTTLKFTNGAVTDNGDGSVTVVISETDANAIHKSIASEIYTISEKGTPVSADVFIIEDSEDSYNKKRVQIGNLPDNGGNAYLPFEMRLGVPPSTGNNNDVIDFRQDWASPGYRTYARRKALSGADTASSMYLGVQLPPDFDSFYAGTNIWVQVYSTDRANNTITMSVYDDTGDVDDGVNAADIEPGSDSTWAEASDQITETDANYAAGDWIWIKIEVNLDNGDAYLIGEGHIRYTKS